MSASPERANLRTAALLAIPVIALLVVIGSVLRREPASVEEHRVQAAIKEYNRALVRAYASQRPELMAEIATDDERVRIQLLITRLAHLGGRLDARQEKLAFETIEARAPPRPEPQPASQPTSRPADPSPGASDRGARLPNFGPPERAPSEGSPPQGSPPQATGAAEPRPESADGPSNAPAGELGEMPADHDQLMADSAAAAAEAPPPGVERVAEATTVEVWWHRQVDVRSGAERSPPKRVRYRMRYHLVSSDARWRIDKLDMIEAEEQPAGE